MAAVARHQRHPRSGGLIRRAQPLRLAVDAYCAAARAAQPIKQIDQYVAPGAQQAGDADDLARLNIKGNIIQMDAVAEMANRKNRRGGIYLLSAALARGIELFDVATDHHFNQRVGVLQQRPVGIANDLAVTQYRAAIAEGGDLVEVVGNIENADPLLPQAQNR